MSKSQVNITVVYVYDVLIYSGNIPMVIINNDLKLKKFCMTNSMVACYWRCINLHIV